MREILWPPSVLNILVHQAAMNFPPHYQWKKRLKIHAHILAKANNLKLSKHIQFLKWFDPSTTDRIMVLPCFDSTMKYHCILNTMKYVVPSFVSHLHFFNKSM